MGVFEILVLVFLALGVLFTLVGVLGILKFPDFFARSQALTSVTTLGQLCSALAAIVACISAGFGAVWYVKLVIISLFVMFTSAISGHALSKANYVRGNRPEGGFAKDDFGKDGY